MSNPSPFAGGNPFEHLLGDLLKLISGAGPLQWDLARQLAHSVATDGQAEANVEPLERIRLEELIRVADLHLTEATGLSCSATGGVVRVRAVGRSEWASRTLDAWRPLLEGLVASLASPSAEGGTGEGAGDPFGDPGMAALSGLLGSIGQVMGPTLIGLQVGSALGHLSRRALGPYVLPVPRPASDELLLVPANIGELSSDWSLPVDDVRLWVCLSELAHHAVLNRPHVRSRLIELISSYVGGFSPDAGALEERLSGIDPGDPVSLQAALGDPASLLGEMPTAAQRQAQAELEAIAVAVDGYIDHVMDVVGRRLITSYPALTEALRRRRVERDDGERMLEHLFGLAQDQASFDRGASFVAGVLERAGEDGLRRLWESAGTLPTPAEIAAPGLWLARIDLPGE